MYCCAVEKTEGEPELLPSIPIDPIEEVEVGAPGVSVVTEERMGFGRNGSRIRDLLKDEFYDEHAHLLDWLIKRLWPFVEGMLENLMRRSN